MNNSLYRLCALQVELRERKTQYLCDCRYELCINIKAVNIAEQRFYSFSVSEWMLQLLKNLAKIPGFSLHLLIKEKGLASELATPLTQAHLTWVNYSHLCDKLLPPPKKALNLWV